MPNYTKKYDWDTREEQLAIKKNLDKIQTYIKYWEKHYNLKIKEEDIETIKKYKSGIKKILPILDFVKKLELIE